MKTMKERIIRFAIKNRKSPMENRRRVGKSLSLFGRLFSLRFFG